jgi:DNA polymerase-1
MSNTLRESESPARNDAVVSPPWEISQEDSGMGEDLARISGGEPAQLASGHTPRPGTSGTTATGVSYEHINLPERFAEYLTELAEATGPVAIDFETTDLRPRFAALVGIALATSGSHGVYISGELGIDLPEALGAILTTCEAKQLTAYNANYELSIAANVLGSRPDIEWVRRVAGLRTGRGETSGDSGSELEGLPSGGAVGEDRQVRKIERAVLRSLTGIHDPMIVARLLNYDHQLGLKTQASIQFGVSMQEIDALIGSGKNQITMAEVDPHDAAPYAADDVIYTWRLEVEGFDRPLHDSVRQVYEYIEIPLLPVSASMGLSGMDLDGEAIEFARERVTKRLEELDEEIHDEFDKAVKDGRVRLELEPMPTKRDPKRARIVYYGPTGKRIGPPVSTSFPKSADWRYNPSSNKQAPAFLGTADAQAGTYELSGMPIALKHRDRDHYAKLLSSYINPVDRMFKDGGRAYFSLNQAGTGTGRYSANGWKIAGEPWSINAQTKPKPKANEDASDENTESKLVGRQFKADEGTAFVEIDYSQIELRVEAHLAPEYNMQEAYNAGRDLHDEMMRRSGLKDRRLAKVANFGCSYEDNDWVASGVVKRNSAKSDILISGDEAMEVVQAFRQAWPGLKAYYERVHRWITERRWVETAFGRRLYRSYVPYPYSKPQWAEDPGLKSSWDDDEAWEKQMAAYLRWKAWKDVDKVNAARRREAINMPIQGTAADILKIALAMLWDTLPDWAEIVLTVHDSILFRCPEDRVKELVEWAVPIMESKAIIDMSVPLKVEAEAGPNWADLKEVA